MLNMDNVAEISQKGGLHTIEPKLRKTRQSRDTRNRANAINLKRVRECAALGMTQEEIADRIHVSPSWLSKHKETDRELAEALSDGFGDFKENLRKIQTKLAMSGHPGMLIWLGKQFLGQSDKQESKTETTVNVVLQNAMKELRDMSADDLAEMREILERKKEPLLIENGSSQD